MNGENALIVFVQQYKFDSLTRKQTLKGWRSKQCSNYGGKKLVL